MSTPYMSEIRIFSFPFAPKTWAMCNGQLLPINQNQALFSLLGTTYGGDGRTTFALPDLRGCVPIGYGSGYVLGQRGGEESHTVTMSEMPQHVHIAQASPSNAGTNVPTGGVLAAASNVYRGADNLTTLAPTTISNVGGSQPHSNMAPYLVLNVCIALQGVFPSQN